MSESVFLHKCARRVCFNDASMMHSDGTRRMYCPQCARKINEFTPGLILSRVDTVKEQQGAVQQVRS